MNQVTERKRLRREYLLNKSKAYAVAGVAGLACVPLSFASIILFVSLLCILILYLSEQGSNDFGLVSFAIVILLIGVICGILARFSWLKVRRSQQALANLPYVPPVTADTLPAEEILVRAADEPPVAQSGVLLRAAQAGQETPKEELLRVVPASAGDVNR